MAGLLSRRRMAGRASSRDSAANVRGTEWLPRTDRRFAGDRVRSLR